ncbi:MAG: bifunctional ornithine acetyltransferase/N-acetylglutamate synthase [Thermoleophilaceae bacterium]|nr:bifunctional ornithine acetyltransferase/N-acetylglutamate synthase [Thermoleophilaceae bacterium]
MTFFASKWVDRPSHVSELEPTSLAAGFRAAGVRAGLKRKGLDVGVLLNENPDGVSAARFTSNARVGAPVIVSRDARLDSLRAVVANAGGSNTAAGDAGVATAIASREAAAQALGIEADRIGLASTGVIGPVLPREPLCSGIEAAAKQLGEDARDFSESILTTDDGPKRACLEVALPSGKVRLSAQAKGAGMISPRYATMFCFVQTDADMDAHTLELLTGVCVKRSFDRISVDGQLSTSDTIYTQASGASGVRVEPESEDELALGEAMDALMRQLAMTIVHDGEGSKRVGRIVVRGQAEAVEPVARSVANSPLVKTALHGGDTNFGRVLQAAGQAMSGPFVVDLEVEGLLVASAGVEVPLDPPEHERLERAVSAEEVEMTLTLPGEGGETEVFFSDLSHEYVTINAHYRT